MLFIVYRDIIRTIQMLFFYIVFVIRYVNFDHSNIKYLNGNFHFSPKYKILIVRNSIQYNIN